MAYRRSRSRLDSGLLGRLPKLPILAAVVREDGGQRGPRPLLDALRRQRRDRDLTGDEMDEPFLPDRPATLPVVRVPPIETLAPPAPDAGLLDGLAHASAPSRRSSEETGSEREPVSDIASEHPRAET